MIKQLKYTNKPLYSSYLKAFRDLKCGTKFIKNSNKYIKSSQGSINTYAVFTDLVSQILSPMGRAGMIVQTGIATNDGTKDLFSYFVDNRMLASLIDFENREKLFPIHSGLRFCLLTITGKMAKVENANLLCYATNLEHLEQEFRYFNLTDYEFKLINPNTKTMPSCRNKNDKNILTAIYKNSSILQKGYSNLTVRRMFHMSDDSNLFLDEKELYSMGFEQDENFRFRNDNKEFYPLYEAKYFHQYIYNFSSFNDPLHDETSLSQSARPNKEKVIKPKFWVSKESMDNYKELMQWKNNWYLGMRVITSPTNERTSICSIIPFGGGNSIGYFTGITIQDALLLVSTFNSFVFDYVSRIKVGGMNYNIWIVNQQPVISPQTVVDSSYYNLIKANVLRLVYYNELLRPFAEDCGYYGSPFPWNDEERFKLQCELDAVYGKLYGISKQDFDYILETFPIVKHKDFSKYGFYRTKETILDYFDKL